MQRTLNLFAPPEIPPTRKLARAWARSRGAIIVEKILAELERNPSQTADEIAFAIDENFLSVRPRVSELYRGGKLEATGARPNASGTPAKTWRIRP